MNYNVNTLPLVFQDDETCRVCEEFMSRASGKLNSRNLKRIKVLVSVKTLGSG